MAVLRERLPVRLVSSVAPPSTMCKIKMAARRINTYDDESNHDVNHEAPLIGIFYQGSSKSRWRHELLIPGVPRRLFIPSLQ